MHHSKDTDFVKLFWSLLTHFRKTEETTIGIKKSIQSLFRKSYILGISINYQPMHERESQFIHLRELAILLWKLECQRLEPFLSQVLVEKSIFGWINQQKWVIFGKMPFWLQLPILEKWNAHRNHFWWQTTHIHLKKDYDYHNGFVTAGNTYIITITMFILFFVIEYKPHCTGS